MAGKAAVPKGKTALPRPKPINKKLYDDVKRLADKKFKSKSGIFRSSWIVREYKLRGGRYQGAKSDKQGLLRWFREKWVDLNRIDKSTKQYKPCGRQRADRAKGPYPLCRPSRRVTAKTPRTYKEIPSKAIGAAKKAKKKYKGSRSVKF